MRKTTIAIILLLSVTAVFGQTKADSLTQPKKCDTIRIRDTVPMPVYLVDVTDTVPATVLYKKSEKSDRIYTVKGFALVRGFKVFVQGKAQWADKPQIVGALYDKKRQVKNVIQIL